jgi:hypothetical protein
MVQNRVLLRRRGILCHAVEHESMNPVACPRIVAAQRLEYNQRLVQIAAVLQCQIEAKIVLQPPRGDHPVHNVLAVIVQGRGSHR